MTDDLRKEEGRYVVLDTVASDEESRKNVLEWAKQNDVPLAYVMRRKGPSSTILLNATTDAESATTISRLDLQLEKNREQLAKIIEDAERTLKTIDERRARHQSPEHAVSPVGAFEPVPATTLAPQPPERVLDGLRTTVQELCNLLGETEGKIRVVVEDREVVFTKVVIKNVRAAKSMYAKYWNDIATRPVTWQVLRLVKEGKYGWLHPNPPTGSAPDINVMFDGI
jgi:hypothetical protein